VACSRFSPDFSDRGLGLEGDWSEAAAFIGAAARPGLLFEVVLERNVVA
jgi:hypothetical protein